MGSISLRNRKVMNKPFQRLAVSGYGNSLTASSDQQKPVRGCKVALTGLSGFHVTDEITCLLRRRLRIAGLIALAGFAAFLVRNLIPPPATPDPTTRFLQTLPLPTLTFCSPLLSTHVARSIAPPRPLD